MSEEILPIIKIGDPVLREMCVPIEDVASEETKQLIANMLTTAKNTPCAGLAASQVGVIKRIFLMKPDVTEDFLVVINPKIISWSDEKEEMTEGCLSIPGVVKVKSRFKSVSVEYTVPAGYKKKETFTGWKARVFQHEFDHLNGILMI